MNQKRGLTRSDALDVDSMPTLSLTKGAGKVEDRYPKKNIIVEDISIDRLKGGLKAPQNQHYGGNQMQQQQQQQWGGGGLGAGIGAGANQMYNQPPPQQNFSNQPYQQPFSQNQFQQPQQQQQQPYVQNQFQQQQQPYGSSAQNMLGGGFGANLGGGLNNMSMNDPVLSALCSKVRQQYQNGKIKSIADFFLPYDGCGSRQFEQWELVSISEGQIQMEDARRFLEQNGVNQGLGIRQIPYAKLANMIQAQTNIPLGSTQFESIYKNKSTLPAIQGYLTQIARIFNQSPQPDMIFDTYSRMQYMDQNEFSRFLNSIGIVGLQPYEVMQLFQYFVPQGESMITKISFIQGVKNVVPAQPGVGGPVAFEGAISRNNMPIFNQGPSGQGPVSYQTTFHTATSFLSANTSGFGIENPLEQQFLSNVRNFMNNNHGLTFEGLLAKSNIQPSAIYIEPLQFSDLCFRVDPRFQQQDVNTLLRLYDQDQYGRIKTYLLRQKIESVMRPLSQFGDRNANFHLDLDSHLLNNQMSPIQSPYGGDASAHSNYIRPPLVLENPISFGPGPQQQQFINQPAFQQPIGGNPYNNFGTGSQYNIQPILDKVSMFLSQLRITNLTKIFVISILKGKQVIELQEFLNFLQSPGLNISQSEAYQVANEFKVVATSSWKYQTQHFIDLERFEQSLYAGNKPQLDLMIQKNNSYMSMNKVYDAIRRYIMINGGDISKFFQEIDINKDNFIQKSELKIALQKIGHYEITDQEIDSIYWNFDKNKDGRISYSELCQQFSEFSNTKAIKDSSHWAYYIFESIRRACCSTQRPIADLFGLQGLNITNLQQKIPISKENFFKALAILQIPLTIEYEKKLLELLDADNNQQGTIDFIHFCEMVGMNFQPFQLQQLTNEYLRNPVAAAQQEKVRKFYRSLFDVMQSKNISLNNLRMIFMGCDLTGQLSIPYDEFIQKLREIDVERRIDFDAAKDALAKFYTVQAYQQRVNYSQFLDKLLFENEKYKVINLIFLTLQVAMAKLQKVDLYELFSQYDPHQMRSFDKGLLSQVLEILGLKLKREEIDWVLIEYDTQGTGIKLDFNTFKQDFEAYKTGVSPLNSFVNRQHMQYNDFQKFTSTHQPSNLPLNNIGRQPTSLIQSILNKIGRFLDSNLSYSIPKQLLECGITKTGILSREDFKRFIEVTMFLNREDCEHMLQHYDPMMRNEIKIAEVLVDIKDQVKNHQIRTTITELAQAYNFTEVQAQGFGNVGATGGVNSILQKYQKSFEEIQKAIIVQNMNTFTYFSQFSAGAPYINKDAFRTAMQRLQLSHLSALDIDTIFEALDSMHKHIIQIDNLDQAIRQNSRLSQQQMHEEILSKLVEVFNGDDTFLLSQLMERDRTRTAQLDLTTFIDYFQRNSPKNIVMSKIDLTFLAMKYTNPQLSPNIVNVNLFLDDFNLIRKQRGMMRGDFSGMHQMNEFGGSFGGNKAPAAMLNTGHRNLFLPQMTSTNTIAEKNHIMKPHDFRISIESQYLEELMRATYLAGKTVQEYFAEFSQRMNGGILQENNFLTAIQNLNINWVQSTANKHFQQIDLCFNSYQQKRQITPEQIDQAVYFGSKTGYNLRNEIQRVDPAVNQQIHISEMRKIILDVIRVPTLNNDDIDFLCKKYIHHIPNQVQYKQFLDDYENVIKLQFSNVASSQKICEYIKKAASIQGLTIKDCFSKYSHTRGLLSQADFLTAMNSLEICPVIFENRQADALYKEINLRNAEMVTIAEVETFVVNLAAKPLKDMQNDVIDEMISKLQARNKVVDNIFKRDDPISKGLLPLHIFTKVLGTDLFTNKLDAELIALRYQDKDLNVNYNMFIKEFKIREKTYKAGGVSGATYGQGVGQEFGFQSNLGMSSQMATEQTKNRLKETLIKINDLVKSRNLQLASQLGQHERGSATGVIPFDLFNQTLMSQSLPIPSNDLMFVADNYIVEGGDRYNRFVDYRQFLQDLKFHGRSQVQQLRNALTKDQADIYAKLGRDVKRNGKANLLADDLLAIDITQRFYLTQTEISNVLKERGYPFSSLQMKKLLSPLDQNSQGQFNYKQMLELLVGEEAAASLFQGGLVGAGKGRANMDVQFVMPMQAIGGQNARMNNIGKELIKTGNNYEEAFRRVLTPERSQGPNPKLNLEDIYAALGICGFSPSVDERIEIQEFSLAKQDNNGLISVIEFLQAIGLPNQTLGPRGQKALPRRILNKNELKQAQDLVNVIRTEIMNKGQQVKDVFEPWKKQHGEISLPIFKFKLALASINPRCGSFTEQQIELLTYYLAQEVQNEISYKKLYLACTRTSTDPPLNQEGAEEIKNYEKKITEKLKKGTPIEILDLKFYMNQNNLMIQNIFKQTQKGEIQRQVFETALKNVGYQAKDMQKLIEILDTRGSRQFVSLDKLSTYLSKAQSIDGSRNITPQIARDRYQGFDAKCRLQLQKISEYLKRKNYTIQKMFQEMDVNGDGTVDKQEFVSRLNYMGIPGIMPSDYGMIFDAIDVNNDGVLSYSEFGMFIEGAKATRQQRTQELDQNLIESMKKEIKDLFHQFDENSDGKVTADEIVKSMMAIGQRITLDEAANMIAQIDHNGDRALDENEFIQLMLPKMKEDLLSQEDSLEDLRAMFMDADVDHSGTLSIDEIYGVIQKLGADVTFEDLIELMNEIDVNRDGELDIDEFIALMNMGDELQFRNAMSKNTFMNIKRARKLHPLDFFKNFKNMPQNFVPSFFTEKWVKFKKNLPSSVFVPQIDPATMLYKDLYPVLQENLTPNQMQLAFQPRVRPLITEVGCQLLLEEATGVPMPASGQGFDSRTQIVKRVVRIGLYDTVKKDFIINAVQVNALYNQVDEDVWKFNSWGDNGTNPVLFKTSNRDEYIKPHIFVIFELVTAVKINDKVTEMSCGWCQLETTLLDRGLKHKLPIKGGSPNAEMLIKDQDIHTNRTGMKYIIGKLQSKIPSQLTVVIRTHQKFSDETKLHLDLLPSTCFIQKRLLYFVSGFRNYIGEKFLKASQMSQFRQPEGDVVISCFPRILDNPDICEQIIAIWTEDVWKQMSAKSKMQINILMERTQEFIQKLYPVIYADEFKFKESDYTMSAAGDQYLLGKREELIRAALCNRMDSKNKGVKHLEELTTFKPFTVRELEFEVWDTKIAKQDRYMRQYEEIGLISSSKVPSNNNSMMGSQNLAGIGQFSQGFGKNLMIDANINIQRQPAAMLSPNHNIQMQQQQQQQYPRGGLMQAAMNRFN